MVIYVGLDLLWVEESALLTENANYVNNGFIDD